jgi:hypothetical protein
MCRGPDSTHPADADDAIFYRNQMQSFFRYLQLTIDQVVWYKSPAKFVKAPFRESFRVEEFV